MAVYTFLEKFDWNGKTIHPFCTHEGSGLSGTEGRLQGVCKGAVVEYSCAVKPHIRAGGNRQSGIWETAIASLLA